MYQYDQQGNKIPVAPPSQNMNPRMAMKPRMSMSQDVKKVPVWGWVVIAVALLLVVAGLVMWARSGKSAKAGFGGKKRSFGFRFY